MNVINLLQNIKNKIKMIFPDLANDNASDYKTAVKNSILNDIKQRLSEMYAILMRETEDDSLDMPYSQAIEQFPSNSHFDIGPQPNR